ncbi:MAG: hypothetical protein ACRDSL_05450 [Pseudonocardiaceae bacterium]
MRAPGQRRGPAETAALRTTRLLGAGLLGAGLLGAGLLGSCAGEREPAPANPPSAAPLPLPQPQPPTGPARPEPGLNAEDRALLAEARRVRAQWVVLLVAPEPGRTDEAVAGLEELGGVLGTGGPGAGLLRLTMPTGNVEQAAALPAVTAIDVEQVVPSHHPRPTG